MSVHLSFEDIGMTFNGANGTFIALRVTEWMS